jgi:hypothetical protein
MASNVPKKGNRPNEIAAFQKLADGLNKHESTLSQVVIAGTSMSTADVIAKVQARLTIAKAVATTHATWQQAVKTDKDAAPQYQEFLNALRQALLAAFAGKVDALADFGLSARKVAVVTPEKKAQAALKREQTLAARGVVGKKKRAAIKPTVTVTPNTVTVNHPAPPAPVAVAASATTAPATAASASTTPAPLVSATPADRAPASPAAPAAQPTATTASPASPAVPAATSPSPATPAAHS